MKQGLSACMPGDLAVELQQEHTQRADEIVCPLQLASLTTSTSLLHLQPTLPSPSSPVTRSVHK